MQRYSVFKRTIGTKKGTNGRKKKSVKFYFQVKDMDTGVYGPALSVEAMRKRLGEARLGEVTSMPEARSVVEKAIERGLVSYDGRKVEEVFLVPYLLNFWDFDNSDYIQMANRLSKNGNAISRYTAKRNMQNLLLHVLPGDKNTGWSIPEDSTAMNISRWHMEKLQKSILVDKGLSPKTWNNISCALSPAFNELVRLGKMRENPLSKIRRPTIDGGETLNRGLRPEEAEKIFLEAIRQAIDGRINRLFCFQILLAGASGMRLGEVRALRKDNILMPQEGDFAVIRVDTAIAREDGFKETKGKRERLVYVPRILAEHLISLPSASGLVFEGKRQGFPICESQTAFVFNDILESIGIKKVETIGRSDKYISFHSLRHFANTEFIDRGGEDIANAIIGHEGKSKMADRYNHITEKNVLGYAKKCGSLLPESVLALLEEWK